MLQKTVNAAERQPVILSTISFPIASKTIDERLVELYCEAKKHDTDEVEDSTTSSLLESLVKKEQLATLIVKLYPNSEGFSIILRKKSGSESETIKLPYEEVDMLSFIDAQELPVMLLDLLDEAEVNLFHNGCIIAEIRDFRYASSLLSCKTHYVLLRPTQQSILADINSVIINSHLKTRDDRLVLESQLVKLASGPLCLDPSPTVFAIQHEITCSSLRHLLHSKPVISLFASHSHGALNRKRKLEEQAAPPYLMLHDFLAKGQKSAKNGKQPGCSLNTRLIVDRWQQPEINITPPGDHVEVAKFAKLIEKPKIGLDCSLIPIEEYVFETERNQSKANFARMTFLQRTADDGLQGELYIDRDYVAGRSSGNSFKFNISSKFAADRYVDQFREIFTEEGRRQVKITHKIQGRAPSITYTQPIGLIGRTTETPASQLQQPEVVQPDAETRKSAMPLIQNQAQQQQQLQQQQQQQLQQQQQQQQLHQHIQQQQQLHQQQQLQSQLLLQSPNQQQHMSSLHHGGAIPQQGLLSASNFSVIPPNVNIQHMAASNAAMSNRPLMVQQSINPSGLVSPNPHVLIPPSPSPGVVHGMTVMPRMPFSNRTGQVLAPQTNMANMQSNVLTPQANLGQALLASQINMSSQINVGSAIRGPGTHVLVSPELMANRPPMMIRQMSQVISPVGEPRSYLHPQQQQMMMMMSGAETNVMDARARVANPSMQNSMMSQMTGNLAARRGRMS